MELNIVTYPFRVGRALYGQPLRLWNSSSGVATDFTTRFTFTIDRATTANDTYADGFAFYIAPHGYQIPPNAAGGTFALFNKTSNSFLPQNRVLAVEFDTFNGTTDPPMQHVGIDDNSFVSVRSAPFDIDNNLGNKCHALITYTASNKSFSVSWSFDGSASRNSNSSLSYQIDLMQTLPEWVDVGFSASTGDHTERNVIHSWQFSSTLNSTVSNNNSSGNNGTNHGSGLSVVVLVVVVTCPMVLMAVAANVVAWVVIMKRRGNKGCSDDDEGGATLVKFDLDRAAIPRRFDYKELVAATNGFADDRRLGRGGSGQVYKGVLSYLGRVVAVKRIFTNFENSERVFINEVRIISRLIHRNLVQFIGWCHEQGEFLLVFEYMPNGSLDTHLFGEKKTLAWEVRYKVALGVVVALHYLHEDAEQSVLHRDIKSANVLLDTNFSTKLGDFGMAKLVDPRLRTQRTGVVGTYGYLAPEYINGGRASKESDIYSFGVVALEIACGRRTYKDGEFHVPLVNWVWQQYVDGNVLDVVDEKLNQEFDLDEMTSLIVVGLWCTNPNDKERPKAAQVIKVLQLELPLPVLPLDMHDHPPPSLVTHEQVQPTNNSLQSIPFTNSLVSVGR
uniref:non-specific serine/threonine protein kinase n=2 Tax=Cajanus cajan TaxID=3821 RepID=A0A151QZ43_CAJCA|nr:Lectin-domain containing receptor kinase A4.1 [Cajanus cajan]